MNTRIDIESGKLVIDMAEADALWNSLTLEQRYQSLEITFQPILESAVRMKATLDAIVAQSECPIALELAQKGLPDGR